MAEHNMRIQHGILVVALSLLGCKPTLVGGGGGPATVILRSGTIHTMDVAGTVAEAMVVRDGEIIYVGDDEGTRAYEGDNATIIDLSNKTVFPGFHDAHTHLVMGGTDLLYVDLFEAATVEALVDTVEAWAGQNPEAPWVQGSGWSMPTFEGLLHKSQLDAVVPDRPVFLYSADGHSAFANSMALELAGITSDTPDPEDGQIERDDMGEPTGVLQEAACDLVAERIPPYPADRVDEGLALAIHEANQFGITTIVDASVRDWILAGYARAEAQGRLTLRVHAAVWMEPKLLGDLGQVEALRSEYSSDAVQVDSVKFFVDGLIESQTAVMLEPYTSGANGIPIYSDEELREAATALDAVGFQLHAHVIGDAAARQFLDTLESVIETNGSRDRRPQLAHLEVVDPEDWTRFAGLGAHANFQMQWAYPDPYIQELTWPVIGEERSKYLYPIGGLHAAGATIVAGSDWPVSSMNPFEAIEVAVTRRDPYTNEGDVLTPEHRIDLETAIRAYTSEGAEATFSEDLVGSLEVGKRADFVVVDRDPFAIPASELSEVEVEATWLDGERVFQRTQAREPAQVSRRACSSHGHEARLVHSASGREAR
jgi:predicted amidohydrolase YtcJ